MNDESTSTESTALSLLAVAHLAAGGGIGLRNMKWIAGDPEQEPNVYHKVGQDDKIEMSWNGPEHAVANVLLEVKRERKQFDDVFFFFLGSNGSFDGVTWRMLKIDMSYLRIVLGNDKHAMPDIIRRFVQITEEAQAHGADEANEFKNLN